MTKEYLINKINLVVDCLTKMGGANYDSDRLLTEEEAKKTGMVNRDFGIEEWDWPQGVGLYGLLKLQKYYGDTRYSDFFQSWFETNLRKGLPSRNINTTAPYLTLFELMDKLPCTDNLYEKMCISQADWLIKELPKTYENGFQHVTSAIGDRNGIILNESELWIDTLFMAVLFLNKMGIRYQNQVWKSEAQHQVLLHIKYLYDKQTRLFYHGWSFNRNDNFGGIFWGRGNSWFTLGIADYLDAVSGELDPGVHAYISDTFRAQASALQSLQAPSGLWKTVLDDPSSYDEVSGSAAIAAGLLKGIKSGLLDGSYKECAYKALDAICENIDAQGIVQNVSAGTAVGENVEHYKNIMIHPMAYGQSLTLIALCEALDV